MKHQEGIPKMHKDDSSVRSFRFEESVAERELRIKIAKQHNVDPDDLLRRDGEYFFDSKGNKYRDQSFDQIYEDKDDQPRYGHH